MNKNIINICNDEKASWGILVLASLNITRFKIPCNKKSFKTDDLIGWVLANQIMFLQNHLSSPRALSSPAG